MIDNLVRLRWLGSRVPSPRPRASLQLGPLDCGPANLRALCLTHGVHLPNTLLRDLCGTNRTGTSLVGLCRAARALGFTAWLHALDLFDLRDHADTYLPAIVALETGGPLLHFVTVHAFRGDQVLVMDPAVGLRTVPFAELRDRMYRGRTPVRSDAVGWERSSPENRRDLRRRLADAGVSQRQAERWLSRCDLFLVDDALKYAESLQERGGGEAFGKPAEILTRLLDGRSYELPECFLTVAGEERGGERIVLTGPTVLVVRGRPRPLPAPPGKGAPRRRLLALLWRHRRQWGPLVLLAVLGSLLGLLLPLISGWVVSALDSGWPPLNLILLAGLLSQVQARYLGYAAARSGLRARRSVGLRLQVGLLWQWHRAPAWWLDDRLPGELLGRYDESATLPSFLIDWPVTLAGAALSFGGAVAMLAVGYRPFLAVTAASALLSWLAGEGFARRLRRLSRDALQVSARYSGRFLECLRGLDTLHLNRCADTAALETQSLARDQAAAHLRVRDWSLLRQGVLGLVSSITTLALMVVAYRGLLAGAIDPGGVVVAMSLGGTATAALQRLITLRQEMENKTVVMERYEELSREEATPSTEILPPAPDTQPMSGSDWQRLTVQGLSYAHEEDRPLLVDVTLQLQRGRFTCLLGSSGAGKTTLLEVLGGIRPPSGGNIFFDGLPSDQRKPGRAGIVLVEQEPLLVRGSLLDNVLLGWPEVSERELDRVKETAALVDVLSRHPAGWRRRVGGRRAGLSGGEVRRVAIARALLRRPTLLLLDESLGGLDWLLRRDLLAALRRDDPRLAVLLTTHDPTDALLCDDVLVLEGGRIVESGPVNDLVQRSSRLRTMLLGEERVA